MIYPHIYLGRDVPARLDTERVVRVTCVSDTYGNNDAAMPTDGGDIYIHAGNFTCRGGDVETYDFLRYLADAPYQHKIICGGINEGPLTWDIMTKAANCIFLPPGVTTIACGVKIHCAAEWATSSVHYDIVIVPERLQTEPTATAAAYVICGSGLDAIAYKHKGAFYICPGVYAWDWHIAKYMKYGLPITLDFVRY